jgi:hypothetical protein
MATKFSRLIFGPILICHKALEEYANTFLPVSREDGRRTLSKWIIAIGTCGAAVAEQNNGQK